MISLAAYTRLRRRPVISSKTRSSSGEPTSLRAASKETPKTSVSSRMPVMGFAKRWLTAAEYCRRHVHVALLVSEAQFLYFGAPPLQGSASEAAFDDHVFAFEDGSEEVFGSPLRSGRGHASSFTAFYYQWKSDGGLARFRRSL